MKTITEFLGSKGLPSHLVQKVVSIIGLGALLIIGAVMVFGSGSVESVSTSLLDTHVAEGVPYVEETPRHRDQRHQQTPSDPAAKEAPIQLNEGMPYIEETLMYRDQRWERRNR